MENFDASKFTLGTLCQREHEWEKTGKSLRRYKKNGRPGVCVECAQIALRKHITENREHINRQAKINRLNNPESYKKSQKKYSENNRAKIRERAKTYYNNNKEKELARRKRYNETNKELIRQKHREWSNSTQGKAWTKAKRLRRSAQERNKLLGTVTREDIQFAIESFDNRCSYCNCIPPLMTIDHFYPLISDKGYHSIDNLVPACHSCNSSKNAKDPFEWYPKRTFFDQARFDKITRYLAEMKILRESRQE